MSHKKFGADRFSRFDVYWTQTNKQPPKQTSQIYIYIYIYWIIKEPYIFYMQVYYHPNTIY